MKSLNKLLAYLLNIFSCFIIINKDKKIIVIISIYYLTGL